MFIQLKKRTGRCRRAQRENPAHRIRWLRDVNGIAVVEFHGAGGSPCVEAIADDHEQNRAGEAQEAACCRGTAVGDERACRQHHSYATGCKPRQSPPAVPTQYTGSNGIELVRFSGS